jgi:small-conductance mechanosensitive channel
MLLLNKAVFYTGIGIVLFIVFSELGIKLSALLGAAGIVGIVLGIASQASIGNAISGLFLVSENTFEIGDFIRVGDKSGIVYSIDLLSIKIRSLDNLLIRIPNQQMIQTEITNITRFPIRRLDIELDVAYKEDLNQVKELLKKIAKENNICLNNPEPLILFKNFGDSGIRILFGVWFEKSNYIKVKNGIIETILKEFAKEGIEIPFPHRTVYTGSATNAFPVEMKSVN